MAAKKGTGGGLERHAPLYSKCRAKCWSILVYLLSRRLREESGDALQRDKKRQPTNKYDHISKVNR